MRSTPAPSQDGSIMLTPPAASGYRMPAEWERHAGCWMSWPSRADQWVDGLEGAQQVYAAIARAISQFEPVSMVAEACSIEAAGAQCGENIQIIPLPIDDPWMRDSGPTFLTRSDGARAGTAWRFNAWGGKTPDYSENARLAARVLTSTSHRVYQSSLCLEGGAIHTDGAGTIITTESVVLNPNRNPGITKAAAERESCDALGATTVIWLPGDPLSLHNDITDGHIDGLMSFVRPGVVIFETNPTATGRASQLAADNRRALETAVDAGGRRLQIICMNDAYEVETAHDMFCRSYVNFYIANGGVVMPKYGVPGDATARATVQAAFPDRDVVQIDVMKLASGGGGIHCITQQQPV